MAARAPLTEPAEDRCPYSRSANLADCEAYTPSDFTPLDTQYRTLRPITTCRHLDIGQGELGGFYPRCALGGAEARHAWVARVGPDRLERLRGLSLEYRAWVRPILTPVWEKKARLLADRAEGRDTSAATRDLEEALLRLVEAAHTWIEQHSTALADAGLAPDVLSAMVDQATAAWAESPTAGVDYQIPDDLLSRFPEEIRVFIRSGR